LERGLRGEAESVGVGSKNKYYEKLLSLFFYLETKETKIQEKVIGSRTSLNSVRCC
jgi:hypothetical protein